MCKFLNSLLLLLTSGLFLNPVVHADTLTGDVIYVDEAGIDVNDVDETVETHTHEANIYESNHNDVIVNENDTNEHNTEQAPTNQPVIAIIIDDIGWRKQEDLNALDLPGAITYSILPQTPNTKMMANLAKQKGKEVMLHVPMQAKKNNHLLGPGALTIDMSQEEFSDTLEEDFRSVPNAIGVNNHMGSLMTQHELSMHRLMNALQRPGAPFFIDSKTTDSSIPSDVAEIYGIATTRRDVFLDNDKSAQHIIQQFRKLVEIAKRKGSALAIGHPYPETIKTLDYVLSNLEDYGVKLMTISEFMQLRNKGSFEWRTSLSHSLSVAKN